MLESSLAETAEEGAGMADDRGPLDAADFPPLSEGQPLVLTMSDGDREDDAWWTGAKHIAFRQVVNAFCSSAYGQDEQSLMRVFEQADGNLRDTCQLLLAQGEAQVEKQFVGFRWPLLSLAMFPLSLSPLFIQIPGCRPNRGWLKQEYERRMTAARRKAEQSDARPPPLPAIKWMETGTAVGAAYTALREEAIQLAKARNRCLEQVQKWICSP